MTAVNGRQLSFSECANWDSILPNIFKIKKTKHTVVRITSIYKCIVCDLFDFFLLFGALGWSKQILSCRDVTSNVLGLSPDIEMK